MFDTMYYVYHFIMQNCLENSSSTAGVVAVLYCVGLVTVKYFVSDITPGPIKHRYAM